MRVIMNVEIAIDEADGVFTATARFDDKELSAQSSRDYAAVAALFEGVKKEAIKRLEEPK